MVKVKYKLGRSHKEVERAMLRKLCPHGYRSSQVRVLDYCSHQLDDTMYYYFEVWHWLLGPITVTHNEQLERDDYHRIGIG